MAKKCKKSDIHCGTILSSHCVEYTGDELLSLDKGVDQCNLSITEVVENVDKELKRVKDGLDTKKLTRLCLDTISKDDTVIIIINKLISKICDLQEEINELKTNSTEMDILSSVINLDSNCLSDAHCSTDSTLKTLLMKMISELCYLKAQVNN